MKPGQFTPALYLSAFMPSVAHASSFALVLYPCGVLTAIAITSLLFAGSRSIRVRVASTIIATLTAASIFLLPSAFYASTPFQYLDAWLGEWIYFVLGFVPPTLMGLLVLRLGAPRPMNKDS